MSIFRNIIYSISALAMMASLTACSDDGDDTPAETRTVEAHFRIYVGNEIEVTRANSDWNDAEPTDSGTVDENLIDPQNVHVVLYNASGNYISELKDMYVTATGEKGVYNVRGDINIDVEEGDPDTLACRVGVYANMHTPSGGWDQSLGAMANDAQYQYSTFSADSIPMWGIQTTTLSLRRGDNNYIGDVYLLRAASKVTVRLRDDMVALGYTLGDVTLNGYNTSGYSLPSTTSIGDTRNLTYTQSFHPTSDVSTESLPFAAGSSISTAALYIPEHDNSVAANRTTITVTVRHEDGSTRTATFNFAAYNSDGAQSGNMNIVRNHSYVFNVYGNPLRVELDVEPWTVFRHNPYEL